MKNDTLSHTFLAYTLMLIIGGVVMAGVKIWENYRMSQKIQTQLEDAIPVEVHLSIHRK